MSSNTPFTYKNIERCNMCDSNTKEHKLLGKRLDRPQGMFPKSKVGKTVNIFKCSQCGLVFSNPMPVPHDVSVLYNIPPTNYWPKEYFIINKADFAEELNKLKKLINTFEGKKVLDIGAGFGKYMIVLENSGFDVYGIEPSQSFYDTAIESMNISPQKLKHSTLENAVFEDNFFDFINLGAVLEHLQDPSSSILKSMQWLKPGGIIHVEIPSSDWFIHKLANFYYYFFGHGYVANLSPMHLPYHLYEFSLQSFRQHAQKNNYSIVAYDYFVCNTYMPQIFDMPLKYYMKRTNSGMQLSVWLQK